jgi:hypothetical protein
MGVVTSIKKLSVASSKFGPISASLGGLQLDVKPTRSNPKPDHLVDLTNFFYLHIRSS